jgi:hypothetical protein
MRISAADFAKKFGELSDESLARPLIVARHGRDRLVRARRRSKPNVQTPPVLVRQNQRSASDLE